MKETAVRCQTTPVRAMGVEMATQTTPVVTSKRRTPAIVDPMEEARRDAMQQEARMDDDDDDDDDDDADNQEASASQPEDAETVPKPSNRSRTAPVSAMNLWAVHERFQRVLKLVRGGLSISKACASGNVPIQTLRDRQGLAELYVLDKAAYEEILTAGTERLLLAGQKALPVGKLEENCRRALSGRKQEVLRLRQKGRLIPFTKLY